MGPAEETIDYNKDPHKPVDGSFIKVFDQVFRVVKHELVPFYEIAEGIDNGTFAPGESDDVLFHNSIGSMMLWVIWVDEIKRTVKFNGGNGAILCSACSRTLKENLSKEDYEDKTPMFCEECQPNIK